MADLRFLRGTKENFEALSKSSNNFYIVTDGNVVSLYLGEKLLAASNFDAVIATEIAKIVASAPEDFDTLKEIADYIASDKTNAAEMSNKISANESAIVAEKERAEAAESALQDLIDTLEASSHSHDNKEVLDGITAEKVSAWDASEQNAKNYADDLAVNYDAAGSAAQALADAKIYADEQDADVLAEAKSYVDGKDAETLAAAKAYADGSAAQALADAKAYTESLLTWGTF